MQALLARLAGQRGGRDVYGTRGALAITTTTAAPPAGGGGRGNTSSPSSDRDWQLLQAQAELHIVAKQPDQALNCFLQAKALPPDGPLPDTNNSTSSSSSGSNSGGGAGRGEEYRHVFELIEKEGMIDAIRERVPQLVRLSRPFAAHLLVRHVDQLPPAAIVRQLRHDAEMLHWYLHTLFTRLPEQYNTAEYAEYHAMQVRPI